MNARRALTLLVLVWSMACDSEQDQTNDVSGAREPSPNATITPSPLVAREALVAKTTKAPASGKGTSKRATVATAAEPPVPLTPRQAPSADSTSPKQTPHLSLAGRLSWPAYPINVRLASATGTDVSRRLQRRFEINLRSHGRMQITFHGTTFPFASGTSIAARLENYGHVLVWPNQLRHRVLPVGSLRSLFLEGRPDVNPTVHLDHEPKASGHLFEHPTRTWVLETNRGKLTLQQAEVAEAEWSGVLVCRFLLEWLSIGPTSSACDVGLLPLKAEFESAQGAKLVWETTEFDVRAEPSVSQLQVPPRESQFREFGIPEAEPVLLESELKQLRKSGRSGALLIHNPTPYVQWLLLDGTPAMRVAPLASITIPELSHGSYHARLVDFFGAGSLHQAGLVVDDESTFGEPSPPPESNPEQ